MTRLSPSFFALIVTALSNAASRFTESQTQNHSPTRKLAASTPPRYALSEGSSEGDRVWLRGVSECVKDEVLGRRLKKRAWLP